MYDIVSIGNATRDVFVHIHPKGALRDSTLCLRTGSKTEVEAVERYTGGGASNTAVAFARLGLRTGISAAVGKDEAGKVIVDELKREGVSAKAIAYTKGIGTAYSVILTGFGDRIILAYCGATCQLNHKGAMKWGEMKKAKRFYVSSLHAPPHNLRKIAKFAERNGIALAMNPGSVELSYGLKRLNDTIGKAELLFLNEAEARELTRRQNYRAGLKALTKLCPTVVITRGARGAVASDGKKALSIGTIGVKKVDTTGAGDAFNSGFTAAIAYGHGIEEALRWGTANSHSVLGNLGTKNILLTRNGVREFWGARSRKEREVKVSGL